jgi:DNA mismatch repair protein MutS
LVQLEGEREGKETGVGSLEFVKNNKSRTATKEGFVEAIETSTNQQQTKDNLQLSFFQLNDPVLENIKDELQRTDINTLTPVEALMKLNEIKKMIGG